MRRIKTDAYLGSIFQKYFLIRYNDKTCGIVLIIINFID